MDEIRVGTKVEILESEDDDDYGEVIEIRGEDAVVRWHASNVTGVSSRSDLVDLVVDDWSREHWGVAADGR